MEASYEHGDLSFAIGDPLLELGKVVCHGEDLYGGNGVKHVRIVARRRSKAAVLAQAGNGIVKYAISRQRIRVLHEVQRN